MCPICQSDCRRFSGFETAHSRLPNKLPAPGTAVMFSTIGLGTVTTSPKISKLIGPSVRLRIGQLAEALSQRRE